ncbi:hypothetical protein JOQ06_016955, partial [Pogonophryne albipinna]
TQKKDILSAHRMVSATQESLKSIARDFKTVKAAADTFAKWTNENIEEREEGTDIEVAVALPQKRTKKRSRAEEMSPDEALSDAERAYEVNVHNAILDTAIETIHRRFMTHGTLFADLTWLDPRNFSQIRTTPLPNTALKDLSNCLIRFDSRATVENLQSELIGLAGQWDRLKASHVEEYKTRTAGLGPDGKGPGLLGSGVLEALKQQKSLQLTEGDCSKSAAQQILSDIHTVSAPLCFLQIFCLHTYG